MACRGLISLPIAAAALLAVVITGSYRRVERVAIAVGLFELAFFFVAWAAHPDMSELLAGAVQHSRTAIRTIFTCRRRISAR